MKKFFNDIADALNMPAGIESALNITDFSPHELKVFLMIRRPPRSTRKESSAASDVYKRQVSEWFKVLAWKVSVG